MPQLTTELVLRPDSIVRMGEEPMRIKILNSASGVKFDECYSQRVVETLNGIEVSLIGLKDLKTNKKASGRLKDLSDLENLP